MVDNHNVAGSSPAVPIGWLAQWVERSVYTGIVGGSSPSLPSLCKFDYCSLFLI